MCGEEVPCRGSRVCHHKILFKRCFRRPKPVTREVYTPKDINLQLAKSVKTSTGTKLLFFVNIIMIRIDKYLLIKNEEFFLNINIDI